MPLNGKVPGDTKKDNSLFENQEALLTKEEVATWLRVHPNTVKRFVDFDGLPHIKLGRSLRFSLAAVSRWLKTREVDEATS